MTTKLKCERLHCKRRALERFNLSLNHKDMAEMAKLIQTQKAEFIRKRSNRITLWRMNYRGNEMTVVYDNKRHAVVSMFQQRKELYDK